MTLSIFDSTTLFPLSHHQFVFNNGPFRLLINQHLLYSVSIQIRAKNGICTSGRLLSLLYYLQYVVLIIELMITMRETWKIIHLYRSPSPPLPKKKSFYIISHSVCIQAMAGLFLSPSPDYLIPHSPTL